MATQIDPVNNIKVKVILQVFSFLSFFLENRCELTNLLPFCSFFLVGARFKYCQISRSIQQIFSKYRAIEKKFK